jgi:ubiquitin C-terminal hydrolase
MNACLQCLFNTRPLVDYFTRGKFLGTLSSPMKGKLAAAFAEMAKAIWDKDTPQFSAVSPAMLKRIIGKWAPHFSGYEQQDCGEFLCFLLNGLAEDVHRKLVLASPGVSPRGTFGGGQEEKKSRGDDDDRNNQTAADEMWRKYLANNNSVITDVFVGQLQSCVECLTCGKQSSSYDPFMDLSVPIPKHAQTQETNENGQTSCSLGDCLDEFCSEEVMDRENMYHCSQCNKRRKCTKRLTIQRFPNVLVLQIKRFTYNMFERDKLTTRIKFPLRALDMSAYASSSSQNGAGSGRASGGADGPTDIRSGRGRVNSNSRSNTPVAPFTEFGRGSDFSGYSRDEAELPPIYDLYAVSNHIGGLGGGHYTASCLNTLDGQWVHFNDSVVTACDEQHLDSPIAYLLFYQKRQSVLNGIV